MGKKRVVESAQCNNTWARRLLRPFSRYWFRTAGTLEDCKLGWMRMGGDGEKDQLRGILVDRQSCLLVILSVEQPPGSLIATN